MMRSGMLHCAETGGSERSGSMASAHGFVKLRNMDYLAHNRRSQELKPIGHFTHMSKNAVRAKKFER